MQVIGAIRHHIGDYCSSDSRSWGASRCRWIGPCDVVRHVACPCRHNRAVPYRFVTSACTGYDCFTTTGLRGCHYLHLGLRTELRVCRRSGTFGSIRASNTGRDGADRPNTAPRSDARIREQRSDNANSPKDLQPVGHAQLAAVDLNGKAPPRRSLDGAPYTTNTKGRRKWQG
jgi:hypothetical protein